MKYFAICSGPEYAMLPVFFSISTELSDYKRFAEGLLDTFTRALETAGSLETRLRSELQKWKLSRLSVGGASFERQGTELLLSSGMAILKHALHDAWRQFIRPAQLKRLEHEKFRSDLAKVTEREAQLLKEVASSKNDEISPSELSNPYDRNYFKRLTEKALLLHVGRGRYKLNHRLFREFLRQTQSTRATAKAKTFAPGRGGKLAAASRSPLHYPQGGLHSLAPSVPYPFPHSHLLIPILPFHCCFSQRSFFHGGKETTETKSKRESKRATHS